MLIACYRKNQIHSQLYVRLTDDESSFSKGCSSACWSSFLSCTTNWDSYISCTMVNNLRMYPKDVKELDLGTWKYRFLPVQLFQYIYIPTFFFSEHSISRTVFEINLVLLRDLAVLCFYVKAGLSGFHFAQKRWMFPIQVYFSMCTTSYSLAQLVLRISADGFAKMHHQIAKVVNQECCKRILFWKQWFHSHFSLFNEFIATENDIINMLQYWKQKTQTHKIVYLRN